MKLTALTKKEGQDILKNRIYILVVFVQVFILLGTFGIALASSIASDPVLLDQYGATSVLKVGVSDNIRGTELETDLVDQKLQLIYYNNISDAQKFLGTTLVSVVDVNPPGSLNVSVNTDSSNVFYPVVSTKVNNAVNEYQLQNGFKRDTDTDDFKSS